MQKKKIENAYVRNKMKIFGNALTDRSKAKIECEINDLLNKKLSSQPEKTEEPSNLSEGKGISKTKKFMVCHKILESLLELMVKDVYNIRLKLQSPQIYQNLKKEMIEIMLNEEKMTLLYHKIEEELKQIQNK